MSKKRKQLYTLNTQNVKHGKKGLYLWQIVQQAVGEQLDYWRVPLMKRLLEKGDTYQDIADLYPCTRQNIEIILGRDKKKEIS